MTSGVRRAWMRIVRNFCLYRRRTDPLCFVPNPTEFPAPHQTIQPHIFSENEIARLLNVTKQLKQGNNSPIRRENFRLALILLYTTGMRRGELSRLTIGDYNSKEHMLIIRKSKFHKSRLIPLSRDAWTELEKYLKIRRNRRLPVLPTSPLLWNRNTETGFYSGPGLDGGFSSLFRMTGIYTMNGQLPRLQDLRHSFAVHALLRWYHEGVDVQAKLPFLSTYMGHVSIASTQYYLRFIEPVLNSASKRFLNHCSALITKSDKGDKL